ncbi:MAG TPA: fused MFS/spermidine synthase [Thermoanaerobaculia bacterium]|jgi:spermidine synthase|nr:fused MFS/spermidine synthase [Thermoanaerobaculia bacterium]
MKRGSRQTASPVPAPGGRILLFGTVFFTNLLSLSCQVLWLRKISFLFGSTAVVFSSVLAIFLLGIAGGALWGSRVAVRTGRPWRLLGWLQIFLGAWVAASLPIFDLGRSLFLAVFPADLAPLPAALVKLAVVFVCMIAPALVIGGVFPLAVRLAAPPTGPSGQTGSDLSLIYGLDTLGAAVGSLLAGFFFVPQCGLSASTWILGVGALDLGLFILLRRRESVTRRKKRRKGSRQVVAGTAMPSKAVTATAPAEPAAANARQGIVLLTLFLSGAAALLLETGWNRFFSLLNGTHVFSTATVLAGFLAGIGLGSLLMSRFIDRIQNPFAAAAGLYAAVALCGIAVFRSAGLFSRAYFGIFHWQMGYNPFQLTVCLLILLIVLLATLALGASFPLVASLVPGARAISVTGTDPGKERAAAAGRAFFANTLGGVVGALLAELVLLPAWGFSGLMVATLALYALAAVAFLVLSPKPAAGEARPWLPAAAVPVLLAGAVLLSPLVLPFAPPLQALYYDGLHIGNWQGYAAQAKTMRVVDESQGLYGQVAVVSHGSNLLLKDNGRTDASTAAGDNRTQLMLGHLPLLFHPNPRRVLDIGLGGGGTLRALVHHPEPQEIVVVEIDPRVVAMARKHFAVFNDRALDDRRVRVVTNDGRNFVDGEPGHFDVITSEPPNLWVSGATGLFTQEFYRSAANRLTANGIFCQWLPLYEMKRNDFRTMIHTIHTVFPNLAFWRVGPDVIVLASPQPLGMELPQVKAKLYNPNLMRDFTEIGVTGRGVLQFMNNPAALPQQVDAFLAGVDALNLDDRPVLEFNTARNLFDLAKGK